MLEILLPAVLLVLIPVLAYKKRRNRRLHVPKLLLTTAIGALASDDVVSGTVGDTLIQDEFLLSVRATYSARNLTTGEGPIAVGFAHSDYSDAEIEECLEAIGSWDLGDLVAQEQARRKVRIVGEFQSLTADEVLNDGKPIKTTCKWNMTAGSTLKFFIWNRSGGALSGGASLIVDGVCYFVPK